MDSTEIFTQKINIVMLKVNLEKQLLKENKSVVSARELLLINEYDSLGDEVAMDSSLKRVFGETSANEGKKVKDRIDSLLNETKKFDQSRVFHISQIEKICKKYHLRFLPSVYYKGTIDKDTAKKINQFEVANGVTCGSWRQNKMYSRWTDQREYLDGNTHIIAPASSFELRERPKDPLLFFQINSEYYYLIHKWGNDLSLVRRFYKILSNAWVSYFGVFIPTTLLVIWLILKGICDDGKQLNGTGAIGCVIAVAVVILSVINAVNAGVGDEVFRFIKKNDWNSPFKS